MHTHCNKIFFAARNAYCSRETSHVLSIYDPCAKKKIDHGCRVTSLSQLTLLLRGSPPKGELCLFVDSHPWSGERGEDARGTKGVSSGWLLRCKDLAAEKLPVIAAAVRRMHSDADLFKRVRIDVH